MKKYILFIDSGIGGLSTLAECIKKINYNYIYYADNKHSPYGSHSKKEILKYLIEIIEKIKQKFNLASIVIACNTATASAIDDLRKQYKNMEIIGTEPAIFYASKLHYKNILSLTTPLTKSLMRYKKLIKKTNLNIHTLSLPNLATDIENFYLNSTFFNRYLLLKSVTSILNKVKKFDCIVLGCTHYIFLKPFFKQFNYNKIIDGNNGIANNLTNKIFISNTAIFNKKTCLKIKLSNKNYILSKKYKKILSQTLANFDNLC